MSVCVQLCTGVLQQNKGLRGWKVDRPGIFMLRNPFLLCGVSCFLKEVRYKQEEFP